MSKLSNHIYRFFYPEKAIHAVKAEYDIPDKINININITPDGWFVATSPDLPGLITEAASHDELLDNFNDAVLSYFDVPKRVSDCVFDELTFETSQGRAVIRKKHKNLQLA
jgi:predicted RNase H-like HicB family nuclease